MKPIESLLSTFLEVQPDAATKAFESLFEEEQRRLFSGLPLQLCVSIIERCAPLMAANLLGSIAAERSVDVLRELQPRVASSIIHFLPDEKREELLQALPTATAKQLRELARYGGDTAGAIMDPRVFTLSKGLSVREAIQRIRRAPREVLHYLYVTARDGKLLGLLSIRDLLLANEEDPIFQYVRTEFTSVADTASSQDVFELMRDRGYAALPVLDFEGRLVGVVRPSEAIQAGQAGAFSDLQKIVGAGSEERALSPVRVVITSRLPWLFVNLLTAFMAAAVVGLFEDVIAQVAALAVLLPVVAGQGGNSGAQSLAVVMRGIALREIIPGVKKRVILKELIAGAFNGIAVALVTGLCVFIWRHLAGDSVVSSLGLSCVAAGAMAVNMSAAALAGAIIPLILKRLGRDPAQSASIFLTTVTDIVGFASFLGFAKILLTLI
jgi:magnesium transporter